MINLTLDSSKNTCMLSLSENPNLNTNWCGINKWLEGIRRDLWVVVLGFFSQTILLIKSLVFLFQPLIGLRPQRAAQNKDPPTHCVLAKWSLTLAGAFSDCKCSHLFGCNCVRVSTQHRSYSRVRIIRHKDSFWGPLNAAKSQQQLYERDVKSVTAKAQMALFGTFIHLRKAQLPAL